MGKSWLRKKQMTDVSSVDQASAWADQLLRWESRGPGDTKNALRRLARRTGVSYATFWSLRYRRPKDLYCSVFDKLHAAHESARQHQLARLTDEIETTKARSGADRASVRAALALVDAANDEEA